MRHAGNAGIRCGLAQGDLAEFGHQPVCTLQARTVGELHVDHQVALVLIGDEALGHDLETQGGGGQQPAVNHQQDDRHAEQAANQRAISAGEPVEDPVETGQEAIEDRIHRRGDKPTQDETQGKAAEAHAPQQRQGTGSRFAAVSVAAGRDAEHPQEGRGQQGIHDITNHGRDAPPRHGLAMALLPGTCGLISVTARAGAMVMALIAEMIVDTAMVRANCR